MTELLENLWVDQEAMFDDREAMFDEREAMCGGGFQTRT